MVVVVRSVADFAFIIAVTAFIFVGLVYLIADWSRCFLKANLRNSIEYYSKRSESYLDQVVAFKSLDTNLPSRLQSVFFSEIGLTGRSWRLEFQFRIQLVRFRGPHLEEPGFQSTRLRS